MQKAGTGGASLLLASAKRSGWNAKRIKPTNIPNHRKFGILSFGKLTVCYEKPSPF